MKVKPVDHSASLAAEMGVDKFLSVVYAGRAVAPADLLKMKSEMEARVAAHSDGEAYDGPYSEVDAPSIAVSPPRRKSEVSAARKLVVTRWNAMNKPEPVVIVASRLAAGSEAPAWVQASPRIITRGSGHLFTQEAGNASLTTEKAIRRQPARVNVMRSVPGQRKATLAHIPEEYGTPEGVAYIAWAKEFSRAEHRQSGALSHNRAKGGKAPRSKNGLQVATHKELTALLVAHPRMSNASLSRILKTKRSDKYPQGFNMTPQAIGRLRKQNRT